MDGVAERPLPYPNGRALTSFEWRPIRYRNVISILKVPFCAGVYVYGKSEKRTTIVDGRARKSYGHRKPMGTWDVFIKDHLMEGYISWAEYERNQVLLAGNAFDRVGDTKPGRGGRALLAGLVCCGALRSSAERLYTGRYPRPVYRCERRNQQLGAAAMSDRRRQAHRRDHCGRDAARRSADGDRGG